MLYNRIRTARDAPLRIWVRVGLLILYLLLAAGMYMLDARGKGLGQVSEKSSVAFLLCLAFATAAAYELVALAVQAAIRLRGGTPGEVKMLISFIRVLMVIAVIIALLYATGKLRELGALMGAFAGLLLGWSLQAPVSGIAAWALITLKRPFRVGDRVLFPSLGLNGDVISIGLMYTKLNQVGGAIGSEEAIGRYILIPNAMLFSQVAINYTPEQKAPYFLDEVVVRLTYDSDWDTAEKILLDAAREVTADIIRETGLEPYIRSDIYDYGVYMRLRYMTLATDRPRIAHEILKRVFREFQRNKKVDFAIPYVYSYRRGMEVASRASGGGREPISEISIDNIDDPEAAQELSEGEKSDLDDLTERIRTMGLLQPIVVQRLETGRCKLLAGRLRLMACKRLGWKVIPAIVKDTEVIYAPPDGGTPPSK